MGKLLATDTSIFAIKTEQDKADVLSFIEKDEWYQPYILECFVKEILNAPLFLDQYKEPFEVEYHDGIKINVPGMDSSDEALLETAQDTGLLLGFPQGDQGSGGIIVKPTRYTAFTSICQRAGLSGSTITNSENKPLLSVLPIYEKAHWLSRGFSLHRAPCKILLRDGKISCMLSNEYEIMSADKVVPEFEDAIRKDHPDMFFVSGSFSHEYLLLDYMLNDPIMEESFIAMLQEYNISVTTVKAGVRFTTSDVGNSCLAAAPFYDIDGLRVRLGKPISLSHDKGHTISQFVEKLSMMALVFKECEDRIEELGNISIKHPKGCFLHILDENRTLRSGSEGIADTLDATFPAGCNAIDIYLALNQIVEVRNQRGITPTQLINLTETISKLMFLDYTVYDHEWEDD